MFRFNISKSWHVLTEISSSIFMCDTHFTKQWTSYGVYNDASVIDLRNVEKVCKVLFVTRLVPHRILASVG